jgi:hypothetical protein
MRLLVVLLAACGSSPPPVASAAPQTLAYRMLDLRRGVDLAKVTLTIDTATARYDVIAEQGRAVDGGFDDFQRRRGDTVTATVTRDDGALVLDFGAPKGGPSVGLTCIDKPFVIAPATATATDDGCGTPAWNGPTEQITLLECRSRGKTDVVDDRALAILAPPPGIEEVMTARTREGCPPLDREARPLLRHASVGRVAPLFTEAKQ